MLGTSAAKALTLLMTVPALVVFGGMRCKAQPPGITYNLVGAAGDDSVFFSLAGIAFEPVENLGDDQYGSISVEFSRDAQGNLLDGPATLHAVFEVPATIRVDADCSGHCIDNGIPLGASTGQVSTDVDFRFVVQGNRVEVGIGFANQFPIPHIDLGLGPIQLYFEWILGGTPVQSG